MCVSAVAFIDYAVLYAKATYGGLHQESLTALVPALALISEGGPAMRDPRALFRERID